MEVTLLEKLIKFGRENGYFFITEIGKLDKSCCPNLKTEVIDFDKTEEVHRTKHNSKNLKSCDALMILEKQNRLDFIEMKGFKQFINRQLDTSLPIDAQVSEKINDFDFISKIRDSIIILNNIVLSKSFEISGKEQKLFHKISKNFIILTDIDIQQNPIEHIAVSLTFLSQTSSNIEPKIAELFENEISRLDVRSFDNIQPPILLSCKNFNAYTLHNSTSDSK